MLEVRLKLVEVKTKTLEVLLVFSQYLLILKNQKYHEMFDISPVTPILLTVHPKNRANYSRDRVSV